MNETVIIILQIVAINIITSATGVLKMVFTTKGYTKPMSAIIFVDSFLFVLVLSALSSGENNGILFAIVFALSKVIGANIGTMLNKKIALGHIEISFFVSEKNKMKEVADAIRSEGYSVNTSVTYGLNGMKRYQITVATPTKERPFIKELVEDYIFSTPTYVERELNSVGGKIASA